MPNATERYDQAVTMKLTTRQRRLLEGAAALRDQFRGEFAREAVVIAAQRTLADSTQGALREGRASSA